MQEEQTIIQLHALLGNRFFFRHLSFFIHMYTHTHTYTHDPLGYDGLNSPAVIMSPSVGPLSGSIHPVGTVEQVPPVVEIQFTRGRNALLDSYRRAGSLISVGRPPEIVDGELISPL